MKIDFKYGDKELNGAFFDYRGGEDVVITFGEGKGRRKYCKNGYELFKAVAELTGLKTDVGEHAILNEKGYVLPERYENFGDLIQAGRLLRSCQFEWECIKYKPVHLIKKVEE